MVLLVEQNQLFVLGVSERGDMEGPVSVDEDVLVVDEGRRGTEGRQGVVTAGTWRNVSFVMEPQREFPLHWPTPLANAVPFRVLVQASFGHHQGSGTTEFIFILDADDRAGILCYCLKCSMPRFVTAGFTGSLRCMMDLGDGQLKRIVHFKLFVAVERLGQPIEEGV